MGHQSVLARARTRMQVHPLLLSLLPLATPVHHSQYGGYHPQPHYGYEHPKHNCSVSDVLERAEICTPALDTKCTIVELDIKRVLDSEQCYTVTRTVCSESTQSINNEICTYSYKPGTHKTTAKTAEVTFEKQCKTQMVTVCQPTQYGGYGHHGYGKRDTDTDIEKRHAGYPNNLCKEVAQETCYNVPVVTEVNPPVEVVYPEPVKTCVNKPISLPRISCENLSEEKCITVPKVEDDTETVEKCVTALAPPACQQVELTLPKQVCVELVYGYAETSHKEEPHHSPGYTQ